MLESLFRLTMKSPSPMVWSRAACTVGPSGLARVSCRRRFSGSAISQVSQMIRESFPAARSGHDRG